LAGAPHGIGTKKQDVVDREYHGDEPESERHRRNDREGGEGRAAERAERVRDVAFQVVDETGAAHVAALVGGKRHRAEARERPGASVNGAQTGGDVLLHLALDMERELLVELAVDAVRSNQRANPQEQVAEVHAVTPASSRGRWLWTCAPTRRLRPPAAGVRLG
jgi:hypothetical protein